MSARVTIKLTVNGRARQVRVPAMKRLLDVLREDLGLTGTKEGCGEGECGACTVLLDGASVNSCLVPAVHADGALVLTVEGLARGSQYSGLQQAFVHMGGSQCGICTPGILVAAHELLVASRGRTPTDGEVREAIAGNLCRCTGYQKIVDAVLSAAASVKVRATAKAKPKAKAKAKAKAKSKAAMRAKSPARRKAVKVKPRKAAVKAKARATRRAKPAAKVRATTKARSKAKSKTKAKAKRRAPIRKASR